MLRKAPDKELKETTPGESAPQLQSSSTKMAVISVLGTEREREEMALHVYHSSNKVYEETFSRLSSPFRNKGAF